jgi:hypothetical protein
MHNEVRKYGYARVSTDGQSVEAQVRRRAGSRRMMVGLPRNGSQALSQLDGAAS